MGNAEVAYGLLGSELSIFREKNMDLPTLR